MNTSFSWNLVTKNVQQEPLFHKKLRQKISKLEKHLKHFSQDSVHLQETVHHWPRPQQEVFELHFVQGFEPDEVAMIIGQPLKTVLEHISAMQSRLREEMVHEEAVA